MNCVFDSIFRHVIMTDRLSVLRSIGFSTFKFSETELVLPQKDIDERQELKIKILNGIRLFSGMQKPPKDAFQNFRNEKLSQFIKNNPDLSRREANRRVKKEWNLLENKIPYYKAYVQQLIEYSKAKETYDSLMNIEISLQTALELINEIMKRSLKDHKDLNKLKFEYPTSAYTVFFKQCIESGSERFKGEAPNVSMIGAAFRSLSQLEKSELKRKAEANKPLLKKALNEWSQRTF